MKVTEKRRAAKLLYMRGYSAARHSALRTEQSRDAEWGRLAPRHTVRYEPLDEILDSTPVRVLRLLRRNDWLDAQTVSQLLGAVDYLDRNAISVTLGRHVRAGLVERRAYRMRIAYGATMREFRITPAGRAWLARRLETDRRVCAESEAA